MGPARAVDLGRWAVLAARMQGRSDIPVGNERPAPIPQVCGIILGMLALGFFAGGQVHDQVAATTWQRRQGVHVAELAAQHTCRSPALPFLATA